MPAPADPDPIDWRPEDVAQAKFEQWPDRWHVLFQVGEGAGRSFKVGFFNSRDDAWAYLLRGLGAMPAPPPPSSVFDAELRTYRAQLDELLGPGDVNEGKWCVIKGAKMSWPFKTWEDALEASYAAFGLEPALVRKIERVETVHWI